MKLNLKKLHKIHLTDTLGLHKYGRRIVILLGFVIFIASNILFAPFAYRLDFSNGAAYTLSPASKKIITNLKDKVEITFFVSSDLPSKLIPVKIEITDLLSEYQKQSKDIVIHIVDPKKDQKAEGLAKESGIPEIPFQQVEQDKYAVNSSYFGILISEKDKKDTIPQATDLGNIEYNITSIIYNLTKSSKDKIALIGLPDSAGQDGDPILTTRQVLGSQFDLTSVDVSSASAMKEISKDYKMALVFDDGQKIYDDQEVNALKSYLEKGGKALFFLDGVTISPTFTSADGSKSNLLKIASDWGIIVNRNLVLSASSELVNFGNYISQYPFWVKTNDLNPASSYFSNINIVTYPFTSAITMTKKDGYHMKELINSTKRSWEITSNFNLDPQQIQTPNEKDLKAYTLMAESTNVAQGKLVVIPSSRFVMDKFLGRNLDNIELVLNTVNDLASGGALSGIRQRAVSNYAAPDLADSQKDIFKSTVILLLPGVFILLGAYRIWRRR